VQRRGAALAICDMCRLFPHSRGAAESAPVNHSTGTEFIDRYEAMTEPRVRFLMPIALITLFITVGLSAHTFAYVDLGTGSYMLQMLTAGLFGMIFAAKSLLTRMRAFFGQSDARKR
jgi:hypothetical protein